MFNKLKQDIGIFLDEIFLFINELGIDVSDLGIDHIALRYKNSADVDKLSNELKNESTVLSRAIVNGRKIYIFKLNKPLEYKGYRIPCVELPYPTIDHNYPRDGWEHVEFVLPTKNINQIENSFKKRFPKLTPDILKKFDYKLSVPKVEGEQLSNPTCILTKYLGLSIKFHPNSIEKVVFSH